MFVEPRNKGSFAEVAYLHYIPVTFSWTVLVFNTSLRCVWVWNTHVLSYGKIKTPWELLWSRVLSILHSSSHSCRVRSSFETHDVTAANVRTYRVAYTLSTGDSSKLLRQESASLDVLLDVPSQLVMLWVLRNCLVYLQLLCLLLGVNNTLELLSWFACFTQGSAETQDSPCFTFPLEVSDFIFCVYPVSSGCHSKANGFSHLQLVRVRKLH